MALSVVDLYSKILPKTNCRECGYSTCLAFASMVVSEKFPLKNCPHISEDVLRKCEKELEAQYAEGKWLKRDLASDAFQWAKERSASMDILDLPVRIGGELLESGDDPVLRLPYFKGLILIRKDSIVREGGGELTKWEQVFIYNHIAQGGSAYPTGKWKGLEAFPNTVSKMKSMINHVENPLIERFSGKIEELKTTAVEIGGEIQTKQAESADLAVKIQPLPKIPVMILFWEGDLEEGIPAKIKFLFDETITEHLDIESIMFMSERIKQLLTGEVMAV